MKKTLAQNLQLPDWDMDNSGPVTIEGPSGFDITSIADIINKTMDLIYIIAGVGLFLMFISAGFSFITSTGDPKKMSAAKQKLLYALVGFIIVFLAYWLTQVVGYMFFGEDDILRSQPPTSYFPNLRFLS